MFIRIPALLDEKALEAVDAIVASGRFADGRESAGVASKGTKRNLQLELVGEQRERLLSVIGSAVSANVKIRAAVLPRRITVPIVSRFDPGMAYGWHIDNPVMANGSEPVRSDVACTIFLSNPDDYEGGELIVQTSTGEAHVRLPRGHAFLYPATSRHRVSEVMRGERLAVVFWIQCLVADAAKRELLNDLNLAYETVMRENPNSEGLQPVQRVHANLVRMWSDI